ncbi:hypothetical protein DEJ25_15165 [Curtobacterium sp. MCPF17_011]|uniref:hypothetical protein n=1 Tax=Curtobacterium sp. MCPF17_011 TaxID=2175652 RepID=UPI000DA874E0|nr:hypothetical protein [Curtobacterium sp. MCPF17_011]PZF09168.1 hypothetical protein DEJ25_15165 [Curtobacterium sp. MCPF17_011]
MLLAISDTHPAIPPNETAWLLELGMPAWEPDAKAVHRLGPGTSEFVLPDGHRIKLAAGNGAGHYPAGYLERLRTTGEC